ncbi:MAG TPA: type II secretion system protein GspM [Solirubrobacteraceae bacterium]|jgi:hypothetical protein|nr:type II secretion system protein GspM [Solirubrobacteraceae bacterium]
MTRRDRLVLIGIVLLAVLAGGWLLVVSPERKQAVAEQAQMESANQQLQSAQTQAATARAAKLRYTAAYSTVVSLGKAVPPSEEVPSLIYELNQASHQRNVNFNSITTGASGGAAGVGAAKAGSAAAAAAPAGFTQMPFTFVFKGTFKGLAHLLGEIQGFAVRTTTGGLLVSGRLLSIQGVDIALESGGGVSAGGAGAGAKGAGASSAASSNVPLTATITATAYVLPASQGLTGGATPIGPSGAPSTVAGGSAGSTTTPAVVRVAP